MILKIFMTIICIGVVLFIWKDTFDYGKTIKKWLYSYAPERKLEEPKLSYKFSLIPQRIARDVEIYGIKWKDDYKEFRLNINNMSEDVRIEDVRIKLELLDSIVKTEVNLHSGCESITFSQDQSVGGIYQGGKMVKPIKEFNNMLQINTARIFPKGSFEVRFIVAVGPESVEEHPGYFDISYNYKDDEIVKKQFVHKILRKNKNTKEIAIDTTVDVKDQKNRLHQYAVTFEEPLDLHSLKKDSEAAKPQESK